MNNPAMRQHIRDDGKPCVRLVEPLYTPYGTVPSSFVTDGASIPWWAWSLIRTCPHGKALLPAIWHDWALMIGVSRAVADRQFYALMRGKGVSEWKAQIMCDAVRLYSAFKREERMVLSGPGDSGE
jgi:hypothetical protein